MKSREDSSQLPQDPGLIWDCLSGWHCWRGNDELAAIEDASQTCRQPQVDRTTALLLGSFVLIIESTTATTSDLHSAFKPPASSHSQSAVALLPWLRSEPPEVLKPTLHGLSSDFPEESFLMSTSLW